MAAVPASQLAFAKAVQQYMNTTGLDGVSLDWQFPAGEKDSQNLLEVVRQLRTVLGADALITLRIPHDGAAGDLLAMEGFVNHFNLMSYDYAISATNAANLTAPNEPLKKDNGNAASVTESLMSLFKQGVSPTKISLGLALHGHTWQLKPGLNASEAEEFGLLGLRGSCTGAPMNETYGAKPGRGSGACVKNSPFGVTSGVAP